MATHVASPQIAGQKRNIPAGMIDDARKHVYEAAIRTPLVRLNCDRLNYDGPAEIYLKLECLQLIGAFKIRGAYNAVRLLPEQQRRRGVWTVSAGNAAQGVALAAKRAGVPCKVLMIDAAPMAKMDAVRRLGGDIVKASYDDCWKALADRAHPAMDGAFVHPFEDDEFMAGNASAGLEILEDLPDVDAIVASFGGGGLSCGIAAAVKERGTSRESFRFRTGNCVALCPLVWPPDRHRLFPTGRPVGSMAVAGNLYFRACGILHIICWRARSYALWKKYGKPCASSRNGIT